MSSAAQAPSSVHAPPRSDVSAAVTQTTRSASSSAGWTRTGGAPSSSRRRRSSLVASCTSTVPRKSRAPVGRSTASSSRRPARRSSPPAIRIVCCVGGHPEPLELVDHGRDRLLARVDRGAGEWQRAWLDDDRDAPAARDELGEPRAGERVAECLADRAATSRSGSSGGGGISRSASSSIATSGTREPERRGMRATCAVTLRDRAEQAEERRAVPELRPGARREQVRRAPVGDDHGVALVSPPSRAPSCRAPGRRPRHGPPEDGRETEEPGVVGAHEPVCVPETVIEQPIAEPTTRPSTTATKVANFGSSKSSSHSLIDSSSGRRAIWENTGDACWCAGSASSSSASIGNVGARRPADLDAVRKLGQRLRRSLADRVDVLLTEAEPEPGIDQRGITGRRDRVVRRATLLDPAAAASA